MPSFGGAAINEPVDLDQFLEGISSDPRERLQAYASVAEVKARPRCVE